MATTLYAVRAIVAGAPASDTPVAGPAPLLLLAGTLAGLALAAAVAWRVLRPVPSYYHRGGLAVVSAFGTFAAAVLATPLYHFLGPVALLALAALGAAAGLALLLRRDRARR